MNPTDEPDHHVTTYLCIGCPLGCRLEVEENDDHEIVEVRGFSCKKGDRFARQEHTDPRRMVTTTVAVDGGRFPRLPVRTVEPVPKDLVTDVCHELRQVRVASPIAMGDVILSNVAGTGIDIISSRDMPVADGVDR